MLRPKPHLKLNIIDNKYFLTHDDLSNFEKKIFCLNFITEICI